MCNASSKLQNTFNVLFVCFFLLILYTYITLYDIKCVALIFCSKRFFFFLKMKRETILNNFWNLSFYSLLFLHIILWIYQNQDVCLLLNCGPFLHFGEGNDQLCTHLFTHSFLALIKFIFILLFIHNFKRSPSLVCK